MKRLLVSAAGVALLAGAALAEDAPAPAWSFSGNLTAVSDYMFRGVSQTLGEAAGQGTLRIDHESGFYGYVFASNIDFGDGESEIEVDLSAGYAFALDDSTTLDISGVYYLYPGSPSGANYDYFEVIGVITRDFGGFTANAKLALSPDFFAQSGFGIWASAGVAVPVTDWAVASANVGYQWVDDNATFLLPDYFHYDVGITLTGGMASFDARYFDTDLVGDNGKFVASVIFAF